MYDTTNAPATFCSSGQQTLHLNPAGSVALHNISTHTSVLKLLQCNLLYLSNSPRAAQEDEMTGAADDKGIGYCNPESAEPTDQDIGILRRQRGRIWEGRHNWHLARSLKINDHTGTAVARMRNSICNLGNRERRIRLNTGEGV